MLILTYVAVKIRCVRFIVPHFNHQHVGMFSEPLLIIIFIHVQIKILHSNKVQMDT